MRCGQGLNRTRVFFRGEASAFSRSFIPALPEGHEPGFAPGEDDYGLLRKPQMPALERALPPPRDG